MLKMELIQRICLILCVLIFVGRVNAQQYAEQQHSGTYRIVGTGQDKCYGNKEEISCPKQGQPFFGQDVQYEGNTPAYRDNGDETITDLNTGLMWQKIPDFVKRSLDEAESYAESLTLAGHDDWRLPTIKELLSITDFRGNMHTRIPYINTEYFDFKYPDSTEGESGRVGHRAMDVQYWSFNRYVGTTMRGDLSAFGFNFADGRIKSYPVAGGKYVRCVRGPTYGVNDFVDNGDGTITDLATGLMWMKTDSGKTMNWEQALKYAETLSLAGYDDWRMPNVKELQSIVDYSRAPDARTASARGAAINPVFDLTNEESWFWSSTTHIETQFAYYVCFGQALSAREWRGKSMNAHGAGAVRSDPKTGDPSRWPNGLGPQYDEIRILNYVRCVRGGRAAPQALPPVSTGSTDNKKEPYTPGGQFSVITVGTGGPVFNPDRSAPSALIQYDGKYFLVDMGDGTLKQLNKMGIPLRKIVGICFTHHHLDHNADVIPLLLRSRLRGSTAAVIGPKGTKKLIDFIARFYKQDIEYRSRRSGRTFAEFSDIDVRELQNGQVLEIDGVSIKAAHVPHTIETFAYRFDFIGKSIVISGDLTYSDGLIQLAKDADILVMDSGGIIYNESGRSESGHSSRQRNATAKRRGVRQKGLKSIPRSNKAHASLEEVATMAAKAGVKKLVLTHFRPREVDKDATIQAMRRNYAGQILFAEDMQEFL